MPLTSAVNEVNPVLLSLKPRQVLLGSSSAMKNKVSNGNNGHKDSSVKEFSLNADQKVLLHQSIASYLERRGFSKTLKKFRSEAQIQKDDLEKSLINLEEICLRYLEMGKDNNTILDIWKDQDSRGDLTTTVDNVSKKKKKKIEERDIHAKFSSSGASEKIEDTVDMKEIVNGNETESKVNAKGRKEKPKKNKSDSLGEEEAPKNLSGNIEDESLMQDPDKKSKKKKKTKSDADVEEQLQLEVPPEDQTAAKHRSEKDSKEKKKKRPKSTSDSLVGDDTELKENIVKKVEKKKKKEANSECNLKEDSKDLLVDSNGDEPVTNHSKISNNDATTKVKKESKKRKRPTSEDEPPVVSEKKDEKPENGTLQSLKGSPENEQSQQAQTTDGQADSNVGKTCETNSTQRPTKKQRNGSIEPKTVKAFQRVKVDDIAYADERLQDNSYWAKDGAETGYGAKAQEILGQVRGRDFRHEKTKKKRGTYRGGRIDLDTHSVKFNYSDDE